MSLPGHAVAKPLLRANSEACSKMCPRNSQRCAESCRTRLAKGARKVAEVPLVRLRRHNLHITAAVEGSPACWGARAPLILVAALTSLRLTCSDLSLKLSLYSVESCRTRPAKGACKVAEVPIERHMGQRTAGAHNTTSFGFGMQVLYRNSIGDSACGRSTGQTFEAAFERWFRTKFNSTLARRFTAAAVS